MERVPIKDKLNLTIEEAAEYSNIGINRIENMLKAPGCSFVLYVGRKKVVKRREFEKYLLLEIIELTYIYKKEWGMFYER